MATPITENPLLMKLRNVKLPKRAELERIGNGEGLYAYTVLRVL